MTARLNIAMSSAQKTVNKSVKSVFSAGHKVVLAYIGFWGVAYDQLRAAFRGGSHLMHSAEQRGETIQAGLSKRFHDLDGHRAVDAPKPRAYVKNDVLKTGQDIIESRKATEAEVESQVESILERMGIPSRDRLQQLSREIETISAKIDQELLDWGFGDGAPQPIASVAG